MCGIAGLWDRNAATDTERLAEITGRMTTALRHRGPDGDGLWTDSAAGIGLGHRRLAILDLSPAGRQPMRSACGRFVLTYNGEIYNFRELRADLEANGVVFRGDSDTEVLLEGIARWGWRQTVDRSVGMFAFAIWDERERQLILVRDRLGIKPLYYGLCGTDVAFASELHAIRRHPACPLDLDRYAVREYLTHGYIPAPATILDGIRKLPPGHSITITADSSTASLPEPIPYWSFADIVSTGLTNQFTGSSADAREQLTEQLTDAVRLRLRSDVPLGAYLSGGIDSSLIVATARNVLGSGDRLRAFTLGFDEPEFDESESAAAIASHLGVEHIVEKLPASRVRELVPDLPRLCDEPFGDSSILPTHLVSLLARQHVTVALSGDGGDELFGGYDRYRRMQQIWRKIGWLPASMRRPLAKSIALLTAHQSGGSRSTSFRARVLAARSGRDLYERLHRHWETELELVRGLPDDEETHSFGSRWVIGRDFVEEMMAVDTTHYLPDDILTKVDRSSMACGLEARVPLLDHRVVEFAWRLPQRLRFGGGTGKVILRELLARSVPRELFERPKRGFGVPLDSWLRGPLRDWGEDLLDRDRIANEGILNPEPIRQRWDEHQSGGRSWGFLLWTVLAFQAWREDFFSTTVREAKQ